MIDAEAAVRVRVAGLVFFKDEILIVEHADGANVWACFPGGRMMPGETPEDCLRRELAEELRLTCTVESLMGVGDFVDVDSRSLELRGSPRFSIRRMWAQSISVDFREQQ